MIAWEVDVRDRACVMSCFSLAWGQVSACTLVWSQGGRTSKASIRRDATSFEGALKLCCAAIRLMRSDMCCSVGARVMDAKFRGNLLPGGSVGH